MDVSGRKIAANRRNAKKSKGPKNTNFTRLNATKHGLLNAGITELDDVDLYQRTLEQLMELYSPIGLVEVRMVERMAMEMIRGDRAERLEAEYITSVLHPPIQGEEPFPNSLDFKPEILDPGLPASVPYESVERLVRTFQRYGTTSQNNLFRAMHELERLQRMRKGERLPAPAALDVTIHGHQNADRIEGLSSLQNPVPVNASAASSAQEYNCAARDGHSSDCETKPTSAFFSEAGSSTNQKAPIEWCANAIDAVNANQKDPDS